MSSDFLFVRPSFTRGLARAFDLFGSLDCYNWSRSGEEADGRAMASDWSAVGSDLASAMAVFGRAPRTPRSGAPRRVIGQGKSA